MELCSYRSISHWHYRDTNTHTLRCMHGCPVFPHHFLQREQENRVSSTQEEEWGSDEEGLSFLNHFEIINSYLFMILNCCIMVVVNTCLKKKKNLQI